MDNNKYLVHAPPSFQDQGFSFWVTLKQKLWSLIYVDSSREQNLYTHAKHQGHIERIVHALESLLTEKISCSQLQSKENTTVTNIDHCQQVKSWDCGIACLLMINRWLFPISNVAYSSEIIFPEEKRLREKFIQNINAKSVWTADLVLELHRLLEHHQAASYLFCSKNMGVDESYRNFGYYRDNFAKDQGRVKDAFVKLAECSSSCFLTSHLPLVLVMNAVSFPNCIAMILVDNSKLHESSMKSDDHEYVGHYVIVCGCSSDPNHLAQAREQDGADTNAEDRCLVLMNPAQESSPTMYILPSRLERSWRASGTDDDLVFVIRQ